MLESAQRSVFHHCAVSNAERPSSENTNQCGYNLNYYVSPEDTTDNAAQRRSQIPEYEKIDTRGVIKAVFWIAISISLSLLIGNLC